MAATVFVNASTTSACERECRIQSSSFYCLQQIPSSLLVTHQPLEGPGQYKQCNVLVLRAVLTWLPLLSDCNYPRKRSKMPIIPELLIIMHYPRKSFKSQFPIKKTDGAQLSFFPDALVRFVTLI